MEKYDNEWLDAVYLRGVFERAIERASKARITGYGARRMKKWTLIQLRRELERVNARLAKVASPAV